MLKRLQIFLLAGIIPAVSACQPGPGLTRLRERVASRLEMEKGTFAVAFRDMATGEELLLNERETFHAASTMKTPVLIEVYKQAAEGRLSLDDSVLIKNEFKSITDSSLYSLSTSGDSEKELYGQVGRKVPLSELVYKMIIRSSNLATNTVIELTGAANVMETMRSLGAEDIRVLRGVEDLKAYEKGLNNTTTAYDLMLLFQKMAAGKTVSPEASEAMIDILLDQQFNEIIPARMPKDIKIAHKTGSITGVRHDSGIVFLPDGHAYVLVLLSKELEDPEAGIAAMADVSKMIYDYVGAE